MPTHTCMLCTCMFSHGVAHTIPTVLQTIVYPDITASTPLRHSLLFKVIFNVFLLLPGASAPRPAVGRREDAPFSVTPPCRCPWPQAGASSERQREAETTGIEN